MLQLWAYKKSTAHEGQAKDDAIEFSIARYAPMARLLSDEDLLFLKAQPGFRREMGKKFKQERRRIFRMYLRELARDFHRLHEQARIVVASLPAEHSSLVTLLLRQQVRFWYELAAVEMRLSLSWTSVPAMHVRDLLDVVGTMQAEVSRLSAPSVA